MTWLGKILTFVVMLAAVVTMYFMAQAYVTRTNWQTRSDEAVARLKTSEDNRRTEERRHQVEVDSLRRQLAISQKGSEELEKNNKMLAAKNEALRSDYEKVNKGYEQSDVKAVQQASNLSAITAELDTLRKRATDLENAAVEVQLKIQAANREETKARNSERLALGLAKDYAARIEDLTAKLADLRARLPGGGGGALPDRPPPPLLPNTRGEVTAVAGDSMVVSIGIDAGLALNTVLEVSRADGTYLGTAKVTDVQGLFPKEAVVTFTPKQGNVPLDRLPPAALPRKGDLVNPKR